MQPDQAKGIENNDPNASMVDAESELMEECSKNIADKESGFTVIRNFDPDSDGFKFELDDAIALHKNMNILQFIRRKLIPIKYK